MSKPKMAVKNSLKKRERKREGKRKHLNIIFIAILALTWISSVKSIKKCFKSSTVFVYLFGETLIVSAANTKQENRITTLDDWQNRMYDLDIIMRKSKCYFFKKRSFSTIMVSPSVCTRRLGFYVNLGRLKLTYRALTFRDYSFGN